MKSLIVSALTAATMAGVGVGGTFALFTDNAETTVNVGAGKVQVAQTLAITSVSELGGVAVAPENGVYTNSIGGTTKINANGQLVLDKWAPGDKAVIQITNNNSSDVLIKTRFVVSHSTTSNPDLWNALTVTYEAVDANNNNINHKFMDWSMVDPSTTTISKVNITIEFKDHDNGQIRFGDDNLDNKYQNCNCTIVFAQEAVQGNAHTDSLIDQLNLVLDTSAAKNNTLHDAIAELQAANDQDWGETLLKNNIFLWNSETDRFVYRDEAVAGQEYKYFRVYDEMPSPQEFSVYASSSWDAASVSLTGIGFDAGSASGITSVNYVGIENTARSNTIRTNSAGTALTINAPLDNVHHYGSAGSLNIIAVANSSYHENGKVAFVEIAKGRIALEKTAEVSKLHLTAKSATEGFEEITIAKDALAAKPEFTRDAVTIPDEGRLVVALQETTDAEADKDYVWLNAVGVYEQITVSDSKTAAGTTWVDSSNKSNDTKDTAKEIANSIAVTVGSTSYEVKATGENRSSYVLVEADTGDEATQYTVDSAALTVTETKVEEVTTVTTTASVVVKDTTSSEAVESTATAENGITEAGKEAVKESAVAEATVFVSGKGTQANPYLVDADHWKLFVDYCTDYSKTDGYYYSVTSDIDVSNYATLYPTDPNGTVAYFSGHIDFNNHNVSGFNNLNCGEGSLFTYVKGASVSIENLTLETTTLNLGSTVWAFCLTDCMLGNVTIKNANIVGFASGINTNNNSLFAEYVGYLPGVGYGGSYDYLFENCNNYANLTGTKLTAAFIGAGGFATTGKLTFKNCKNYGTIISTGDSASMFISNCTYLQWGGMTNIIVDDCQNFGTILGAKGQYSTLLTNANTGDSVFYTANATLNGVSLAENGTYMGLAYGQNLINQTLSTELLGTQPGCIVPTALATSDNMFVLNATEGAVRYELAFSFASANRNGGGAGYTFNFTDVLPTDIFVGSWITKSEAEASGKEIVEHNEYGSTYYTCDGSYVYYEEGAKFHSEPRKIFVAFAAYGENGNLLSVATYTY